MLSKQLADIGERIKRNGIDLKDALSVLQLTLDDQATQLDRSFPYDTFSGLHQLMDRTVHGAKIERFRPTGGRRPLHSFEILTEDRKILGHLNMIYLKKVIPCYYLVYVEVLPPFRGRGLGNRILKTFMEFAKERKAVGLLDNIIPTDEPTYEIYTKLGWKRIRDLMGHPIAEGWENYMVFIPDSVQTRYLKKELSRILFNLGKSRPAIDMHDNEDMVKRTIEEFRSVYQTLTQLFTSEISSKRTSHLMRFMFTRLTTKLIGFRRRITSLIGYTGGESLEQISLSDAVKELPILPYSPWKSKEGNAGILGERKTMRILPEELKEEPTLFIENLPFYRRPYLEDWINKKGGPSSQSLKISDLLDLGFDPTRLREFSHDGIDYIFERISPHFLSSLVKKRRFLRGIAKCASGARFRGATVRINPPLLIFQDRGNVYALRKKVGGIHSQEALDQLKTSPYLREMNNRAGIDRAILGTIKEINAWLERRFNSRFRQEIEELTYFIPWNIEKNFPGIHVDTTGISIDHLWIS
ncbi:MAG TPA: GNAT family N-acetyltransferase [Thermodesulfobacteriota bacterium]|nr:GNAT family N-acetyltransferase [Thermodesulfobacteriota bacterium]